MLLRTATHAALASLRLEAPRIADDSPMPNQEVDGEQTARGQGESDEHEQRFFAHRIALMAACGRAGIVKLSSGRQTHPPVSRAAIAASLACRR